MDKPIVLGHAEHVVPALFDPSSNTHSFNEGTIESFIEAFENSKEDFIDSFMMKHGIGGKVTIRFVSSQREDELFDNPAYRSVEYPLKDNPTFSGECE